ncbi:MAG: DUF916 domain-containing protein [bacterium]|nr:DUF916 domain-containing protein [bacterium]
MRIHKYIAVFLGFLMAAGLLVAGPAAVRSQDDADQAAQGRIEQFLEISPPKFELNAEPGETVSRTLEIKNRHVGPITLRASFDNILPLGDEGATQTVSEPTPYDLKAFASVDVSEFTLGAGESREVTVTIAPEADVSPGGYYGVAKFTPVNRTDLPPVAIQGEIGALFLVRVPGPVEEGGTVKDVYVARSDDKRVGWLYIGRELKTVGIVHNSGNVHFATAPQITARDLFGSTSLDQKFEPARNVFPQGDRRFEADWKPSTGYYTVKVAAAVPGDPNAERTIHVLVLSPIVAIGIALALLVLLAWITNRIRHRRRAKKGK